MTNVLSDEDLYEAWERELTQIGRKPNVAVIASLEQTALARGFTLPDVNYFARCALVAAPDWDPDLHPRGRDGQFIEKLGILTIVDFPKFNMKEGGAEIDLNGRRAQVLDIRPDPKQPGNPDIQLGVKDKSGKTVMAVTVKPKNLEQAPDAKATLTPDSPGVAGQKMIDRVEAAKKMYGEGSPEALEAEEKFGADAPTAPVADAPTPLTIDDVEWSTDTNSYVAPDGRELSADEAENLGLDPTGRDVADDFPDVPTTYGERTETWDTRTSDRADMVAPGELIETEDGIIGVKSGIIPSNTDENPTDKAVIGIRDPETDELLTTVAPGAKVYTDAELGGTSANYNGVSYNDQTGEFVAADGHVLDADEAEAAGLDSRFPPDDMPILDQGIDPEDQAIFDADDGIIEDIDPADEAAFRAEDLGAGPSGSETVSAGFRLDMQNRVDSAVDTEIYDSLGDYEGGSEVRMALDDFRASLTGGRLNEMNETKQSLVDAYNEMLDTNELDDMDADTIDELDEWLGSIFEGDLGPFKGESVDDIDIEDSQAQTLKNLENMFGPPDAPSASKKFDPDGDRVEQFKTGEAYWSTQGRDDYGKDAATYLTDEELDEVIAYKQAEIDAKAPGMSPTTDMQILQAEKSSRGGSSAPDVTPTPDASTPDGTGGDGVFQPQNYNKMKAGDADAYLAGLTPDQKAAAMDVTQKDVPARAKKFSDEELSAAYAASGNENVQRDLKIEGARRGLDTSAWGSSESEAEAAPSAEAPASDGSPSAANGWVTTAKSGDEKVPIWQLPVGAEVMFAGKPRKVGSPILLEGDDPADPDAYRFRWWDGQQWDWVMPNTTFDAGAVPPGKKLHGKSIDYAKARDAFNAQEAETATWPGAPKEAPPAAPLAEAAPAAPAARSVADIDSEIANVDQELSGFNTKNGLGPAAQSRYDNLWKQRSALSKEKDTLRRENDRAMNDSVKALTPGSKPTPEQKKWAIEQLTQSMSEDGSNYSADDPTIIELLKDELAASPTGNNITIGPPSESEVTIPRGWAIAITG